VADRPPPAPFVPLEDAAQRINPTKRWVLLAVMRRLWPCLVEATLIPTTLCYVGLLIGGLALGIAAAATWTYLAVGYRIATGRQVSGLLVLATLGLSLRVTMYVFSDSAVVYFAQPIARTVATAVLFTLSAVLGRPFVARFARDFCSFTSDVAARPAVVALFRRLTFLWAGAQAATAAINLTLLFTVPVTVFVGAAAATAWLIMGLGTALTVADSVRTTRGDGLRTVIAEGGRLHAYVT
jgi:hypothetical protein